MDYKTKKISRKLIRAIAQVIRYIFKECISDDGLSVDVIKMLELSYDKFKCITYEIVEDDVLKSIPCRCNPDFKGNYHIQIKDSVYVGAAEGIGGYRMHIVHELSHAFMCIIGFTPVCDRGFNNFELRPYESMEWQAKALAGEIMMDHALTEGMSIDELMNKCGVSLEGANNRYKRKI